MRVFRDHRTVPEDARGASAAIGNFDGVHRGHAAILDLARGRGAPLGVVTFEPHPRAHFAPDAPAFRLMDRATRARRLASIGVDLLYELPFDGAMAALSPDAFARSILIDGLGLSHAVVGADFRFARDRAGTADALARIGAEHGLDVTVAPLIDLGGVEVSSTRIRKALGEGRPRDAAAMLGHAHRIEGPVLHGEKRGRTLGYPTANLALDGLHPPRFGVYAVRVTMPDGVERGGVASLGIRPQFGGGIPNLEVNVLDFGGDLYGRTLSVALIEYLRPEATFDDLPGLVAQMDRDAAEARAILAAEPA